jgi:hypothetical protein
MTRICNWRDLPFREIWAVDTEYYPGPGLANGGRHGDMITPLCLAAIELRSGRTIQLRQDELGPFPPYRLDADAVIITFMATAELGFHLAAGWGQPARQIDLYIEFRHLTNDARIKAGDRDRGFHSLAGALRWFREDEIDTGHKKEMRDRILQGPPFTLQEQHDYLDYCLDDTQALARLIRHMIPTIPSLEHALYRGQYTWAIAQQERRGIPVDLPLLERLRDRWDDIRVDLVAAVDAKYGCYEIVDGKPHFRDERFIAYLRRHRIDWPKLANGQPDKRSQTFSDMAKILPRLTALHDLRNTLAKLRLNSLAVGRDGRNRTLIGPFGTKTGRNAPRASQFIFGPAKWVRSLITPPPGLALVHRDFAQQEVRIAAVIAGEEALMAACNDGDVYLGIAKRLGLADQDATPETHPAITMFKTVVLGIQYGLGALSLAQRTGVSLFEAGEILARLRAEFRVFEAWADNIIDRAGLIGGLTTAYGWSTACPPGTSFKTIRNWPIQAAGAAILHAACILAERRGIRIVAPIHDAFLIEAPLSDAADASIALDQVMRDASRLVLRGYELPTSGGDPILPGGRFCDERGADMWKTVTKLIAKLERKHG